MFDALLCHGRYIIYCDSANAKTNPQGAHVQWGSYRRKPVCRGHHACQNVCGLIVWDMGPQPDYKSVNNVQFLCKCLNNRPQSWCIQEQILTILDQSVCTTQTLVECKERCTEKTEPGADKETIELKATFIPPSQVRWYCSLWFDGWLHNLCGIRFHSSIRPCSCIYAHESGWVGWKAHGKTVTSCFEKLLSLPGFRPS